MINEFQAARAICAVCGRPIKDRPKTCDDCGKAYCHEHLHNLTLVRSNGTDVHYSCLSCVEKLGLQVIDPNHPLYLNNK